MTHTNETHLTWRRSTRLIDTNYPPIDVFASLTDDPDENEALWVLECRTNPRLYPNDWNLDLVRPEDVVSGSPGASILMAAMT